VSLPNIARVTVGKVRTSTLLLLSFSVLSSIAAGAVHAPPAFSEDCAKNPVLFARADLLCAAEVASELPLSTAATTAPTPNNEESAKVSNEGISHKRYPKSFQIPILFMTDRTMDQHQNFGNGRMVESSSINDVYCGELSYSLRNDDEKQASGALTQLGWKTYRKARKLQSDLLANPEQPSDELQEFGKRIVEYVKKTSSKELVLFIPGYNNSFESSAKCAALLAYQTERPVLLYSWPSTAKVLQYFVDSGNNEWSQEHFNRLVELLRSLKDREGINVEVVAHSMGNRLFVRSAPVLGSQRLFEQVFLVDPDLDTETFLHYVARYAQSKDSSISSKMHILFSHKDNALPVAQMLFGGYTRLGQGADTIAESMLRPTQVMPAMVRGARTALTRKKSLASESSGDFAHNLFRKELDWIDFTALDHGIIGHSIPYRLIASVSQTDSAGAGLAFEPVQVGTLGLKDKMLSRYFANKKQCNPLGVCKRVVYAEDVAPAPTTPLADTDEQAAVSQ